MADPYNKSYPQQPGYPTSGYQQGAPYPGAAPYPAAAPYPGAAPMMPPQPQIGFVNPSYPMPPPQQGAVPLFQPYAPLPESSQYAGGYDPENPLGPEVKGFDFTEQSVRKAFIRKVYSILSCQLLVTLGFVLLSCNDKARRFMITTPALLIVAFVVVIVTILAISCVESLRRKSPINYIMLSIFTIAESYLVAASCTRFDPNDVALAIGLTTAICIGLTIFAFQTKWDFTMMGGILFVCLILLFVFSIVLLFFNNRIMTMVYSSLGVLLFSVYLIYDTQMMMGGTHKHSISPEEYVFAALTLYLDIINIFLYILSIIGASKD